MHLGHVQIRLKHPDTVYGHGAVFCTQKLKCLRRRGLVKGRFSGADFKHSNAKLQLVIVPVQIRVCGTVTREISCNQCIKVVQPSLCFALIGQWEAPISDQIGWSLESLKSNADDDTKVGPGASDRS